MKIKVYNKNNLPVADITKFIPLQEDFKITDDVRLRKLMDTIIERGFKYAFTVWEDHEGKLYIVDAHHRRKALLALRDEGYEIPPIPYTLIHAKDKREAVEEIAFVNSQYSEIYHDTMLFANYDIDLADLTTIEIPDLYNPQTVDSQPPDTTAVNGMDLQAWEKYDYIVFLFRNERDWLYIQQFFELKNVYDSFHPKTKKIGLGRVIDGSRLLDIVQSASCDTEQR